MEEQLMPIFIFEMIILLLMFIPYVILLVINMSRNKKKVSTKVLSCELKDARLQAEKLLKSMDKVNERINKQSCQIKNQ